MLVALFFFLQDMITAIYAASYLVLFFQAWFQFQIWKQVFFKKKQRNIRSSAFYFMHGWGNNIRKMILVGMYETGEIAGIVNS